MVVERRYDHGTIKYTATATITVSDAKVVGPSGEQRVVILKKSGVSTDVVAAWTSGQFFGLTKTTAADAAIGEKMYVVAASGSFTSVATSNVFGGYALTARTTAQTTLDLDLWAL